MYIVFFQKPGAADELFGYDIAKTLRFWYRKSAVTLEDFDKAAPDAAKNLALAKLFEMPEEDWGGDALLTPEETAYYNAAFAKTGFTGGLNWYRNFTRNWERSADLPERIDVP